MAKMTMLRLARKDTPARKVPVRSTRYPIINGPINPPTSAKQKKMPPADPIYLEPTSGVSINISITRANRERVAKPYRINAPSKRGKADTVTDTRRATAASKDSRAMNCPLKRGGTARGITKTAGIAAKRGVEATYPAIAGGIPHFLAS